MIVVVHSACYLFLSEEKESYEAEMTSLREQVVSLSQQLDSLTSSSSLAQSTFTEELTTLQGEREGIGAELAQTQGELKTLKEDGVKKTEMITKVCTISRQFIMQCVCMMLVYAAPVA